ncbi:PhzF family phenazine biosynthesis protein [Krasilnikovia sp. M28-CT-15]|uniref:PhzF family phenazine biosynthesis protein n=1 Tax=Krasilnikovia sp. M28-CT-15 TaxID=3373540 RepID=UPI00387677A6
MTTANGPETWLVDAFTSHRGGGNQAAVVALSAPAPDSWLSATAADLALPVTTYFFPEEDGCIRLRWFAPSGELPSCGHGSLAAAAVLIEERGYRGPVTFDTALGLLTARRTRDGIELTVPAQVTRPWELPGWAIEALGISPLETRRSERHALVRVASQSDVDSIEPDLRALAGLPTVGLAVTAPGTGRFDLVSRWFVPREGIEDQATGTAHAMLAPYWCERTGRSQLVAQQRSARGGEFELTVDRGQVTLWGQAIVTVHGNLSDRPPADGGDPRNEIR